MLGKGQESDGSIGQAIHWLQLLTFLYVSIHDPRTPSLRKDSLELLLEGLESELERRARVRDLELFQDRRMQDTEDADLQVVRGVERSL